MKKPHPAIQTTIAALIVATLACSTTTFESTWRDPEARPIQLAGKKVVGIFMSRNPATRRAAEDAMAREITARGGQGVPGYTLVSDAEVKDQDAVKAKLDRLGFSGVVVMRVVGREKEVTYEPGVVWARPYYRHFWGGYWAWGWGRVYDPGYLKVDRVVKVETLVYSLEQDALVWAGVSRTVDPARIDEFIGDLAKAVSNQMAKEGIFTRG